MSVVDRNLYRHLGVVIIIFSLLLVLGSLGYRMIEGWSWADSLYMAVITLSTVGFGEIRPLSAGGRIFTGALIVMGVGATAYTFSTVANYIVAGEFRGVIRRNRMHNRVAKLEGHYIICGYGRIGCQVVRELLESHIELVVIDLRTEPLAELEDLGVYLIEGNAIEDPILLQAGIEKAAGLCCCLPHDTDNVFVALSARTLNPNLTIIARANNAQSERKLQIAGADHVINPYTTSGHRMARQLIHPSIIKFMDVVMRLGKVDIVIEDIHLSDGSVLGNQTIADTEIRKKIGATILAVRRPGGQVFLNPDGNFSLQAGDTLIALGTIEQLSQLAVAAA